MNFESLVNYSHIHVAVCIQYSYLVVSVSGADVETRVRVWMYLGVARVRTCLTIRPLRSVPSYLVFIRGIVTNPSSDKSVIFSSHRSRVHGITASCGMRQSPMIISRRDGFQPPGTDKQGLASNDLVAARDCTYKKASTGTSTMEQLLSRVSHCNQRENSYHVEP